MSKSDGKCRGLQSDFMEASKYYSYGKAILKTKSAMSASSCDPCQGKTELQLLIQQLNMIRAETARDWCYEGYCLGIFTPNRGRIDRYLEAYKEELEIHKEDCKRFKQNQAEQKTAQKLKDFRDDRKAILQLKYDHLFYMKQMELTSNETIQLATLRSDEKVKEIVLASLEKVQPPAALAAQSEGPIQYIKNTWSKHGPK